MCRERTRSTSAIGIGEGVPLHFGNWLKIKRTHLNISLAELADICGCSRNYLSIIERNTPHHETGSLPHPSNAVFKGIAHGLGLSVQEVRDAWHTLGNSSQRGSGTDMLEQEFTFEYLKTLYADMEEEDRKEMMAYAQFRMFRRNPQSVALMTSSPLADNQANGGDNCLRIDMETGAVYTQDGQQITDQTDLLEIAALIKVQVTQMEIKVGQGKSTL